MTRALYAALLAVLAHSSYASTPTAVPELDGAGALSAIALLAGVVAVAVELRRRGARRGPSR